jgi:hypothetical protein
MFSEIFVWSVTFSFQNHRANNVADNKDFHPPHLSHIYPKLNRLRMFNKRLVVFYLDSFHGLFFFYSEIEKLMVSFEI